MGGLIKGNKKEKSKVGKIFLKMVEKEKMSILNSLEKCEGTWKWQRKEKKSVIDYVLTEEKSVNRVTEIKIDERREWTPSSIKRSGKSTYEVYTDHNAIEWIWRVKENIEEKFEKEHLLMTKNGYMRFKRKIKEEKVSDIWKIDESLQVKYEEWSRRVNEIREECKVKVKRREKSSLEGKLMKRKRKLKREKKRN